MQTSNYDTIAQSFLDAHPVGTVLTGHKLQQWVAQHADGEALKPDLSITDPVKRVSALRRHLNEGGRSDAMAQERRFQVQVDDAKLKTFIIRSHADVVRDQAVGAVGKTVIGALSPLKASQRAIRSVKLEELSEIERQVLETARENIVAMEKAVKPTLAQEVDRIWIARMAQFGIAEDQARKLREGLPQVTQLQKLLKATETA